MSKAIKQMQMDSLKHAFGDVRDLVLLSVVGFGAVPENKLRLELRKKGIRLQMVKNTLARKVFSDLGVHVKTGWEGATTVAWGGTSAAELAKEMEAVVKKNDKFMKVKIGVADGQEVAFDIMTKLPTREQAIGTVISLMLGGGGQLLGAILGAGGRFAGVVQAIAEKKEEGAAPPAP